MCLRATFALQRKLPYHLLNTYLPTSLIVIISWLSFWINPDNVPARISLAISTFLTLHTASTSEYLTLKMFIRNSYEFFAIVIKTSLPPVSYLRAVDVWLFFCQAAVFMTLIEFVLLHAIRNNKLTCVRSYFKRLNVKSQFASLILKITDGRMTTEKQSQTEIRNWVAIDVAPSISADKKLLDEKEKFIALDNVSQWMFPVFSALFCVAYFTVYCTNS